MNIKTTFVIGIFIALSLFVVAPSTQAQVLPGNDPVTIQINPEFPKPNQNTTVSIKSFSIDLNTTTIIWSINGTKINSGKGLTSVVVQAGANGTTKEVAAAIITSSGLPIIKTITISPAEVDLVWDAHTYTPPFYKGKGLFPYQGEITVAALPNYVVNGVMADPKTLVYTWETDSGVIGSASGYGKDSIRLQGSIILRPLNISVKVTSADSAVSFSGIGRVSINPQAPVVLMYEDNPLYGTRYNQALGSSYDLKNAEIRVKAAPYYFSTPTAHDGTLLNYSWSINGSPVSQVNSTNMITLRPPQGTSGASNVSVSIKSPTGLLQYAGSGVTMNFKAQ